MPSPVWNTPHLAEGAPEPKVDPNEITVYNMRYCPFAQRTMLTLLEKKVPFKVVNINLTKKPSWFLENTWGTVSVIRHKGAFIMESLVNSDYIDELFPASHLHSKDPLEKAQGRLLVELYSKAIPPYYGIMKNKDNKPEAEKLWAVLSKTLVAMDTELGRRGTRFFSGSSVGMTDLMVWPWVGERLPVLDIIVPGCGFKVPDELSHLKSWIAAMWETDSVSQYGLRKAMLHVDFYAKYFTGHPEYDALLTKGA